MGLRRARLRSRRTAYLTTLAVCIAAAAGPSAAAASSASSYTPPTISPLPGTPDASPSTQISILGVPPRTIASVLVRGSQSGVHPGSLRSYSGGRGASFLLARPLTGGERVHVTVHLRGHPSATTSFTVARLAALPPVLATDALQPSKLDHFVSAPTLLPPRITVLHPARTGVGDLFLAPLPSPEIHPGSDNELTIHSVGPGGPMIINSQGHLVWFDQVLPPDAAANFRPQRFEGHEVLTWWQGEVTIAAFGLGEGVIADTSYQTVRTVHTGNGYQADIHEFLITGGDQALFTAYTPVMVHLTGSPAGQLSEVLDSIVQEVDIPTGLVTWEWHGLGHIPLADSYATEGDNAYYDAYHLNSIQPLPDDRLLVSARDTSAVYEIDMATGHIIWTLGGRASSFRLGRGARFYFQHDAQLRDGDRLSLFDDGGGPPVYEKRSRGLVLALNLKRRTAHVVHQYVPGVPASADSEGSLQMLPGGNVFVGYGATPYFAEFSAAGRVRFEGALPVDDGSYRVFDFPWHATPRTPPDAVAQRTSSGAVSLYVSWNGATSVARWRVLAVSGSHALHPVATVSDRNFETHIVLDSSATSFELQALGFSGKVLGHTRVVSAS